MSKNLKIVATIVVIVTAWLWTVLPGIAQILFTGNVPNFTPGGNMPVGGIIFIASGTCASGYSEATELDGMMIHGTLSVNNETGTTGGEDSITPQGFLSTPSFSGTPATLTGSVSTPSFTGNALAAQSHTLTTFGTIAWPAGQVPTASPAYSATRPTTFGSGGGTSTVTGPASYTPTLSWPTGANVPAYTGTGSQATSSDGNGTPAGSVSTPTLAMNSYTPSGTLTTPTFTGTAFNKRPAYMNLIGCRKT